MPPKTRSLAKYRGQECLNCGVPLDKVDKFCHQCGQLNSTKKLALKDFFAEFVSNIFSYDSRGWRTIKHILFKPGFVSKEFISGKRMSYANPFRFFLSVCIVFFLMVQGQQYIQQFTDNPESGDIKKDNTGKVQYDLGTDELKNIDGEEIRTITDEEIAAIEKQPIVGKKIAQKMREQRDAQLNQIKRDSIEKPKEPEYMSQQEIDSLHWFKKIFKQIGTYKDYYEAERELDPAIGLVALNHRVNGYNKAIYDRGVLLDRFEHNPETLLQIMLPKLPVFLFLFTPLITLFLWLLYARREFNYMEHLIFSFNVLTFVFLSSIIMLLLEWVTLGWLDISPILFLLIGPFYLYKSMRNFYGQGRFKTILKFLLINFVYAISFGLGITLLLIIGIAMN